MQGAVAPLQVYCQRRHLQLVVIPDLISLAYLRFFTVMADLSQVPQHHSHLICMLQDSVPAGSLQ